METLEAEPALQNAVLFTIATAGYVPFAANLEESLRRVGLGDQLTVYTPDTTVARELSALGVRCRYLEHQHVGGWSEYGTSGFVTITAYKFAVACEILKTGSNALFIDSDIVFLKNPTNYLREIIEETSAHLVIQFESPKRHYNTGFWYAKSCPEVLNLFGEIQGLLADRTRSFVCDQTCFNEIVPDRPEMKLHPLDVRLFACGNQFLDVDPGPDNRVDLVANPFPFEAAYMLHFNYAFGKKEKAAAMKEHNAVYYPGLLSELYEKPSLLSLTAAAILGADRSRRLERVLIGEPLHRWPQLLLKRFWAKFVALV